MRRNITGASKARTIATVMSFLAVITGQLGCDKLQQALPLALMTTVGIKLDDETQKRLRDLGAMKDRSPHWLMKEAITRYLDIEEQVERERREDQERYERFVATGEHIPHDQMMVWLDGLVGHKRAKTRSVAKRRVAKRRPRKPK